MKNHTHQVCKLNSFTRQAAHRLFARGLLMTGLLSSVLFSSPLMAEIVNNNTWVIKSGDSLYKIARVMFPESAKKRAQLRKVLVKDNPDVFKNGVGNISIGDQLQLPAFAVKQEEPEAAALVIAPAVAKPVAPVITPQPAIAKPAEIQKNVAITPAIVTPDPQDIVGQVVINVGDLKAENRGSSRPLNRRSPIYRGDTLATGGRSMTQIRLKDGALLSLRPHTQIKIAQFQYNGTEDGTEKSVIELLKGGFRTITGAIGHINKQNYQVKTSMATIGIRGTHYSLILCQQSSCNDNGENVDDGLYGGVADGSIILENQSGTHTFDNDQFFHLVSASMSPTETFLPPHALHHGVQQSKPKSENNKEHRAQQSPYKNNKSAPRRLAIIFEANQPSSVKKRIRLPGDIAAPPISPPALAPNGSGVLIGFNEKDPFDGSVSGVATPVIVGPLKDNVIILGPERTPIAIAETLPDEVGTTTNDFVAISPTGVPLGVPSDLGRDTNLGVNWGRWNGDFIVRVDGTPIDVLDNLHFIYSENLTSPTQLANLSGIKSFTSYLSTGGTLPTDDAGNLGTNFANISMGVNFITQTIDTYNVSASVNAINYDAGILGSIPFGDLNSSFSLSGSGNCSTCLGEASVLFVAPNASGAITSFQIDNFGIGSITGAAVLTEQGQQTIP